MPEIVKAKKRPSSACNGMVRYTYFRSAANKPPMVWARQIVVNFGRSCLLTHDQGPSLSDMHALCSSP